MKEKAFRDYTIREDRGEDCLEKIKEMREKLQIVGDNQLDFWNGVAELVGIEPGKESLEIAQSICGVVLVVYSLVLVILITPVDCGACACLEQVRRCAAQTSARLNERNEQTTERMKGRNEKPAARSKAVAAKPLGASLYLSRDGNGFYFTFAL